MAFPELEGRVVRRSVGEFHVHGDRVSLLHLGLYFGDGEVVAFGCASDGQSLQVASESLRNYDMAEHGRVEVREFGLPPGDAIVDAVPMVDQDRLTFGVFLRTRTAALFVFNWGDDLLAQESLPQHVREACVTPLPL